MKKRITKPQVNVGENKRQPMRLRSVNATCFIRNCLPCGVFLCSRLKIFLYKLITTKNAR